MIPISLDAVPAMIDGGWRQSQPDDARGLLFDIDPREDVPSLPGPKVFLWEYMRSVNGGRLPPLNWQLTGSCVNGGAQNALTTLIGMECACLPDAEVFRLPFTLAAYGQSRGSNSGEGEGSRGDAMAQTLSEFGTVPIDDPSVTVRPAFCGPALVYDRAVELKFSAGRNTPDAIRQAAKAHTITYGVVRSADELEAELRKGRPCSFAGMWGGRMECSYEGTGENKVLMNYRSGEWSHQQSVLGMWLHATLGRIFYVQNQWYYPGDDLEVEYGGWGGSRYIVRIIKAGIAHSVHGKPAQGEPEGGYWISEKDADWQCRTGEVRSFKSFRGYGEGLLRAGGI